jgi:4-amino-4-deoxy-L-arabinose transferase-like glycosyltransferase
MDAAASTPALQARRFTPSIGLALVALAVGAGIALRVAVYLSVLGDTNSDEAVLGLMARHALHGQFTTFLWGTAYGGSQEAWLATPIFGVFGSSVGALRVVPMALDVIAVLLIWRVGLRTIGERAAVIAAALYWLWPPEALLLPIKEIGFYASNAVYCALILLLVLRAYERPDAVRVGALGLVLGLGLWQTTQIVPLAIPAVLWLVWRRPRVVRYAWLAVPLAVLGALPWLAWTFKHDFASLHLESGVSSTYGWRLRTFVSPVLPMALGLRLPGSQAWLVPGLALLAYVAVLILFAYGAYRARRRTTSLLYAVCVVFPFLMAISPKTYLTTDPRYVSVLMPVFALLAAQFARTYVRATLVLVVAGALTVAWVRDSYEHLHAGRGDASTAPHSIAPLIATLDGLHIRRAFADYWIAYRLAFESRERIIAVENKFDALYVRNGVVEPTADPFVRYWPYDRDVRASARHAFIFFRRKQPKGDFISKLRAHGYTRHDVQTFVAYVPPD